MSARGFWLPLICGVSLSLACSSHASEPLDRAQIQAQKEALQLEREAIAANYALAARQCWQQFMVNDCLSSARLQRRQSLAPVEKQEQALRAVQRAMSVIERQERLDAKQPQTQGFNDSRP